MKKEEKKVVENEDESNYAIIDVYRQPQFIRVDSTDGGVALVSVDKISAIYAPFNTGAIPNARAIINFSGKLVLAVKSSVEDIEKLINEKLGAASNE